VVGNLLLPLHHYFDILHYLLLGIIEQLLILNTDIDCLNLVSGNSLEVDVGRTNFGAIIRASVNRVAETYNNRIVEKLCPPCTRRVASWIPSAR
jgi:hypothetical protein